MLDAVQRLLGLGPLHRMIVYLPFYIDGSSGEYGKERSGIDLTRIAPAQSGLDGSSYLLVQTHPGRQITYFYILEKRGCRFLHSLRYE